MSGERSAVAGRPGSAVSVRLARAGRGRGWSGTCPSWAGAMIHPKRASVQLLLDLAESPAPAAALWELVGEEERQAAMALLAVLIAQTIEGDPEERAACE